MWMHAQGGTTARVLPTIKVNQHCSFFQLSTHGHTRMVIQARYVLCVMTVTHLQRALNAANAGASS